MAMEHKRNDKWQWNTSGMMNGNGTGGMMNGNGTGGMMNGNGTLVE
jgi:hypothetical protein